MTGTWWIISSYERLRRMILVANMTVLLRATTSRVSREDHHPRIDRLIGSCAARLNPGSAGTKTLRQSLGRQLRGDPTAVALVLSRLGDADAVAVYERIDDTPLGALAQSWLARRRPPSAALADLIVARLAAGPAAGTDEGYVKALKEVQFLANSFGSDQLHTITTLLMDHVGAPINPYAPNPLTEDHRSALVAVLIARPESQDDIEEVIRQSPPLPPTPPLVELAAAGISGRPPDWGSSFVSLATKWTASSSNDLSAVAELASDQSPLTAMKEFRPGGDDVGDSVRDFCRLAVVFIIGPTLALAIGLISRHWKWSGPGTTVGIGDAIAVLALIATINIFSVQLSADRLSGPLARVAAQPIWLKVSYNCGLTLFALTLFPFHSERWTTPTDWAMAALAIGSIISLVTGLIVIASRTDPASAAHAYVSSSLRAHKRSGRWFGTVQATATELRAYVDRVLWVEVALGPQFVGRRVPIEAPGRGLLLPKRSRLDRLGRGTSFMTGEMYLRLHAPFGVPLDKGTVFASLRPNESSSVARRDIDRATQALRLVGVRRLDQSVAAGSALTSLALDLARRGDTGSAHHVADRAAHLVAEHVAAARRERRRAFDQRRTASREERNVLRPDADAASRKTRQSEAELTTVSPVLTVAVRLAVNNRLHVARELGDVPEYILGGLLEATTLADGGCAIASGLLPRSWTEVVASPEQVGRLIELIAIRALELDDRNSLVLIRTAIAALMRDTENRPALEDSGSVIAANSCWLRPNEAPRFAEWYCGLVKDGPQQPRNALRLLRIGGAALASGRLQVALMMTALLSGVDLSDPNLSMSNDAIRTREALLSNMGGRYLGDSPADALANFLQFAVSMRRILDRYVVPTEQP